jgi:hypothetical protein
MQYSLEKSIELLERTPDVLFRLTEGLSSEWTLTNEGADTWSVFDVVGHLIHGENTDWVPRAEIILSGNADKRFPPFDRLAQTELSKGKDLTQLLHEFKIARTNSLTKLKALKINEQDLQKTGLHPTFGEVTLGQLLATWVVHDLDHISQIARVMAKQYQSETGPWIAFLKILHQ